MLNIGKHRFIKILDLDMWAYSIFISTCALDLLEQNESLWVQGPVPVPPHHTQCIVLPFSRYREHQTRTSTFAHATTYHTEQKRPSPTRAHHRSGPAPLAIIVAPLSPIAKAKPTASWAEQDNRARARSLAQRGSPTVLPQWKLYPRTNNITATAEGVMVLCSNKWSMDPFSVFIC